MIRVLLLLCVLGVGSVLANAQGDDMEGAAPEAPMPPPAMPKQGDVVMLKSGAVLDGVQVLRHTPKEYEIELVEGTEPLRIPSKQVLSVEYDDIDPLRLRRQQALMQKQGEGNLIPGRRLKQELDEKLRVDLSGLSLEKKEGDLVDILAGLGKELGVNIEVSEPVRARPVEQRQWSLALAPGMTLPALFRESLLKDFGGLEVVYMFDKVLVTTQEDAKKLEESVLQGEAEGQPESAKEPAPPKEPEPPAKPAAKPAPPKKPVQDPFFAG